MPAGTGFAASLTQVQPLVRYGMQQAYIIKSLCIESLHVPTWKIICIANSNFDIFEDFNVLFITFKGDE